MNMILLIEAFGTNLTIKKSFWVYWVFLIKTYFKCFWRFAVLYVCASVEESIFLRITVKILSR